MEEFKDVVKSDESRTMDRQLKQRSIVPEMYILRSYFCPCAAHVDLDSNGRHVATIISSNSDSGTYSPGTVQCTFNADSTKCYYTEFSPFNFDPDMLEAMVKEESESISVDGSGDDRGWGGDGPGIFTNKDSLWMPTGGCVSVSKGLLITFNQKKLPTIKLLT